MGFGVVAEDAEDGLLVERPDLGVGGKIGGIVRFDEMDFIGSIRAFAAGARIG